MIRKKLSDLGVVLNHECDLIHTEFYQPSIVEDMYNETIEVGDENKQKAYTRNNDVTLLFSQQRLLRTLGADTLNKWIEALAPKSDNLSELRSKCTDEQLLQICKSRYIQKPSELLAWSEYLNANAKDILAKIQAENENSEEVTEQDASAATAAVSSADGSQPSE